MPGTVHDLAADSLPNSEGLNDHLRQTLLESTENNALFTEMHNFKMIHSALIK